MKLLSAIVIFALIGCTFGQGLQKSLIGSWKWPADFLASHNVGDVHFCGSADGQFWGSAGKIFKFQGTHVDGATASGQYFAVGDNSDLRGQFELALTNGAGGQMVNVSLSIGGAPFTDEDASEPVHLQLPRLANGGVTPTDRQCFTATTTGEDASKGVSGTWVGGAYPRLERGPSGTYAMCLNDDNTVFGSYDNVNSQGYIVGTTIDGGQSVSGKWYEIVPGAGNDVSGDFLLSTISLSHLNGFKWNKAVERFSSSYNGDFTLTRASELATNAEDLVRRCQRNAFVLDDFSAASHIVISALVIIVSMIALLF